MKRWVRWSAVVVCAVLVAPVLRADVKTRDKTLITMEGILGVGFRMFGGSAAKDGVTSTVAVKGNRKSQMTEAAGRIVDLDEQKVYTVDVKKKEYRVLTFAEMRAEYEKQRADAQKQMQNMKPEDKQQMEDAGKQLEFSVDVKETGQKKSIAGFDTHEVITTVTGHEKGKTLDDSGGVVLTTDAWIAPKVPALDEVYEFELRFMKAAYGENFAADMQQMAQMIAMYPAFKPMAERMATEGKKVAGTTISSTLTFESVRSAEEMKQLNSQPPPSSSGGIGGMLAKKMMGNKTQPQQRTKVMTTQHDMLSVETTVSAADVAIPAGFKLVK